MTKKRKTTRKSAPKLKPAMGSTLDSLLEEDGLFGEATACAVKRVIAWQVQQAMEHDTISNTEMARRMGTSRSELARLLDPANDSVTLKTIDKAAAAVGRRLQVTLVDAQATFRARTDALARCSGTGRNHGH